MAGMGGRLGLRRIAGGNAGLPPRLTFVFFALPFQMLAESLYWVFGRQGNLLIISLTLGIWLIWFTLIFLVALPSVDRLMGSRQRALHLATVAVLVVLACVSIGEIVGVQLVDTDAARQIEAADGLTEYFRYNDATALGHQASETLLRGENPYTEANIVGALEQLDLPATAVTPLKHGDFAEVFPYPTEAQLDEVMSGALESGETRPSELESKIAYPAGSFLFQTPFLALGLEDLRIFYLLCAMAVGAIVFFRAPSNLRPVVAIAFVFNLALWNLVASGTTDTLYVLFVLLGWILRPRLLLSAVFMGLAASTKQIAWLYVLFYLILVLRETGWKAALQSVGVTVAVFSAINLPFIFDAPQHWLEGVLAPVLDPMFPRGVGVVGFTLAGILPPDAALFAAMEVGVLVVAAIWYYCSGYRYPHVGLLLAVLPFFFAWRSYSCYFYFASLLVFGAVVTLEYGKPGKLGEARRFRQGKRGGALPGAVASG